MLGFQANNTPANGTTTMPSAANDVQTNGAVLGVKGLPSTSTVELANLAGPGTTLISAGGGLLFIRRRKK